MFPSTQNEAQEYLQEYKKYMAHNKVKFAVSGYPNKTYHTFKEAGKQDLQFGQKSINRNQPRNDTYIRIRSKDIKIVVVCMPYVQEAKEKIEHVKWRRRRYKKTQVKFIEMKNILDEINGILVVAEEISECEYTNKK